MSKKDLSKVLVIDVEATCDEPQPKNFISEIIEVGIAEVDTETLKITKSGSLFVKPQFSPITEFCTKLTSLTADVLNSSGMSFYHACNKLETEYHCSQRTWVSFGYYDKGIFEKNAVLHNIKSPFDGRNHINIENLHAIATGSNKEKGMPKVLKELGLELEGKHHRGVDDAYNIAKIFIELMKRIRG